MSMKTEQEIRDCLAVWLHLKARDPQRYDEFDRDEGVVRIAMLNWVLGE